jgi:hypothetical protein
MKTNNPANEGWIFTPGEGWKLTANVDSVVRSVTADHIRRAEMGLAKYGVTLDRKDLDLRAYLQHAKEEAMDLALYLEKAIQLLDEKETTDRRHTSTGDQDSGIGT